MITVSIWGALGLIAIGAGIAHIYNWIAWRKYYEGKREGKDTGCKTR